MAMPHEPRRQHGEVQAAPLHLTLAQHRHYEDLKTKISDIRDDVLKEVAALTEGFQRYFPNRVQFWNATIDYAHGLQAERDRETYRRVGNKEKEFEQHAAMTYHYSRAVSAILYGVTPNPNDHSQTRDRITHWALELTSKTLGNDDKDPRMDLGPEKRS